MAKVGGALDDHLYTSLGTHRHFISRTGHLGKLGV